MQYGAVVTSDRDIGRYAERLGIATIPSRLFERRMEAALTGDMKEMSMDEEEWEEDEFIEARKKGPARRLSKQERRRQAVLAKL